MFEFLMLVIFFGAAFWFVLPGCRSVSSRQIDSTQRQQLRKPSGRSLPKDSAEHWSHSGRS
ncbi:MAG: hypothetical protein C0614_11845 [Desulfuromonas sp.]|nr:MAG: hypothetical protein C0614_11845 [Desulfuromonas sp.]